MYEATHDGSPAGPDRTGRRPLAQRQQLRTMLERSTGITPQALGYLPGLVVAVLDLDYVAIELTSTVAAHGSVRGQVQTDVALFDGMPEPLATVMREHLDLAARGHSTTWRYVEKTSGITFDTEAAPIQDPFTAAVVGIVLVARDASEQAAAEHVRDAVLRGFRSSFELAPIPQALLDDTGQVQTANAAFTDLVGRSVDELAGMPFTELVLPRDVPRMDRAVEATLRAPADAVGRQDGDARLLREDGESVHCAVHMIGMEPDAMGARTIVQVLDQTERDRYEQELRTIANHDSLTGLLNRRGFRERVGDSLSTGRRRNEARALLLIDIDHFKTINDLHGHAAGDAMLCELAEAISAVTDPRDPAARIAGDEFAVLCVDGPTAARASAAALLQAVRDRSGGRRDGRVPMTVSIGLAEVDPVMDDVDDVLMRADMALYEAKDFGRDRVIEAGSTLTGDAARRSDRILATLREAIRTDALVLHSQPILDLHTGRVSQHEMLARMLDDDGELLSPGEFLPIAERHGLMPELDAWVSRQTIGLLGAQRAQGRSLPKLHVNMSARSADHPELLHELTSSIAGHDLPPGHLVVELSDTSRLADLDMARRFVDGLSSAGCPLALDEFGAGWGSLVYLRELPVEYVKIDGSITRDAAIDERAATLIEGVASTARSLGVRSVAPYVDTQACLTRLGSLGVDYAQGFQVGKPMPLTQSGRPARAHVAIEAPAASLTATRQR
ncbi:MAG: EAL domain-containing protein [Solirubrobacteraceae bacterium]|nr:EAL domain-containing protein [Solirubrobacteraceae bacterium]